VFCRCYGGASCEPAVWRWFSVTVRRDRASSLLKGLMNFRSRYCSYIQYSSIRHCIMVKVFSILVRLSAAALFFHSRFSFIFLIPDQIPIAFDNFEISGVTGSSLSTFTSSNAQSARTRYASAIVYV
jgi:hypothetical protein